MLLGLIIAGREIYPWAYMMPISVLWPLFGTLLMPTPPETVQVRQTSSAMEEDPENFYKMGEPSTKPPTTSFGLPAKDVPEPFALSPSTHQPSPEHADLLLPDGGAVEYHMTLREMLNTDRPKSVSANVSKPSPTVTEILDAMLLEPASMHSRQMQVRREYPHEIELLRSEATEAGFTMRRSEWAILRKWLESLGDELDSIF